MSANSSHFLAFAVVLAKLGHRRTSQTPSRRMCCPVQGIAILNLVKSVALRLREVAFATSTGRQRVGECEYHHGSRPVSDQSAKTNQSGKNGLIRTECALIRTNET